MIASSAAFIAGRNSMLARQIAQFETQERSAAMGWQCHYDKERRKWIVTLDGHEITAVDTKKEAVEICNHEQEEERSQTVGEG